MFSNYWDWICPFIGEFLHKKNNQTGFVDKSIMYRTKLKEPLVEFEQRWNKLLRIKRPEHFNEEGEFISQNNIYYCANTNMIYEKTKTEHIEMFESFSIKYKNELPIVPISHPIPLIGHNTEVKLIHKTTLFEDNYTSFQ